MRVGGTERIKVDVRIIAATNQDLEKAVREGRFREDLYYRLNVFPITIPALRKRKEDIPHLVRVFADRFSSEQKNGRRMTVNAGALALLTAYDWPGNIRQLENAIFRAVVLAEGPELTEADFPQIAAQLPNYDVVDHLALVADNSHLDPDAEFPEDYQAESVAETMRRGTEASDNAISSVNQSGDVRRLADVEEELIRFALKFYRGQMSQVARKLGIGRSTLYRKLKDYGIEPDNPQKDAA
jgi:DNA-binding NtrC family response regulator